MVVNKRIIRNGKKCLFILQCFYLTEYPLFWVFFIIKTGYESLMNVSSGSWFRISSDLCDQIHLHHVQLRRIHPQVQIVPASQVPVHTEPDAHLAPV